MFPHERNVSACVLSFRLVCCSLATRPRRAPSPRSQTLMGKGNPSFRGSAFSTARRPFISPAPEGQRPGFHPPMPGPLSGPGGGERGRAVRATQRSAAAAAAPAAPPLHLLPSPRTGRRRPSPAPPSPLQHPLSTSADPRALRNPRESSSARANSGEAAKLFHPGRPGDAGMEPPESTYPEVLSRSLRRPSEALPPRPARGRPERAAGAGQDLPKRPTPGGGAARAARGGGAEAALRGRAGCARGGGRPPRSAPAGCRWISACPPPGPGITWPGPPAAAPDTGSRRKPEAARPRGLRRPPPNARGRLPRPRSPGPEHRDRRGLRARGARGCALVAAPARPGPHWPRLGAARARGRLPAPERRCALARGSPRLSSAKSHHSCDLTWPISYLNICRRPLVSRGSGSSSRELRELRFSAPSRQQGAPLEVTII